MTADLLAHASDHHKMAKCHLDRAAATNSVDARYELEEARYCLAARNTCIARINAISPTGLSPYASSMEDFDAFFAAHAEVAA